MYSRVWCCLAHELDGCWPGWLAAGWAGCAGWVGWRAGWALDFMRSLGFAGLACISYDFIDFKGRNLATCANLWRRCGGSWRRGPAPTEIFARSWLLGSLAGCWLGWPAGGCAGWAGSIVANVRLPTFQMVALVRSALAYKFHWLLAECKDEDWKDV